MEKPAAAVPAINPWAAVPLVALAGCVDAIGWLRFDQLFVSFISGTSTMLGIATAEGHGGRAAELAGVVGLFALGALAGAAAGALAGRVRSPVVLLLVAALLAAALLLPGGGEGALPPAAYAMVPAMGMLNTALPGVGGITFVTGALSRAMEGLVQALRGRAQHAVWAQQAACWAAMCAGALLGARLHLSWGEVALIVPATAALLAALLAALPLTR
ncbi:DUF1275 family protein [Paracraurococcus lichenis]|uniref:DUF1275 family protein n=1 Tax=Paracraurococcus lichenis TaxID=3064888 RepID=A0ABT9E7I8_9PROT|nr:DUF1275 family protein [Paracraurococcus sp. LOR1-02]MDO9712111.1 DUF1275 family protein [Paracraurococcus sp. LOR1-02]